MITLAPLHTYIAEMNDKVTKEGNSRREGVSTHLSGPLQQSLAQLPLLGLNGLSSSSLVDGSHLPVSVLTVALFCSTE